MGLGAMTFTDFLCEMGLNNSGFAELVAMGKIPVFYDDDDMVDRLTGCQLIVFFMRGIPWTATFG
jgi:hypothetical protein